MAPRGVPWPLYEDHMLEHPISIYSPRPTQPPTLSGTGYDYRPKCGDALRLGVKAGWLISYVDKHVGDMYSYAIPS